MAYTCDDLQSWVPWQYVNIDINLKWIKSTIEGGKNDFGNSHSTSVDNNDNQSFQWTENDEKINKYSDEENKRINTLNDVEGRFKKDQRASLKSAKIDRQRLKDIKPVLANFFKNNRNSFLNRKSWQKLLNKRNDESPRVLVNKCFLQVDGKLTCQSNDTLGMN